MSAEDARNERQDKDGEEEQFSGRGHLSSLNSDLKQNMRNFQSLLDYSLIHSYHLLKSLQLDWR